MPPARPGLDRSGSARSVRPGLAGLGSARDNTDKPGPTRAGSFTDWVIGAGRAFRGVARRAPGAGHRWSDCRVAASSYSECRTRLARDHGLLGRAVERCPASGW